MVQIVFFVFGLCYGASTFLTAASVYVSAYKDVPEGECKLLVKLCAWVRTTFLAADCRSSRRQLPETQLVLAHQYCFRMHAVAHMLQVASRCWQQSLLGAKSVPEVCNIASQCCGISCDGP